MGHAYVLVGEELRQRLYDRPAKHGVYVLRDTAWGEGLRLLRLLSDKLGPGDNGQKEIIVDGDGFRFKNYEPGYET
jgi:hypothetical protein